MPVHKLNALVNYLPPDAALFRVQRDMQELNGNEFLGKTLRTSDPQQMAAFMGEFGMEADLDRNGK